MHRPNLSLAALCVGAFSLATWLEPGFQEWVGPKGRSADVLTIALGDSRRLFAKHAYVKADAYFHGGYYPTIYDQKPPSLENHLSATARSKEHDDDECSFLGKPKDWIDGFSRHFYPSAHRHLGEAVPGASRPPQPGEEREMLPWFRVATMLDPQQTETYVVAAYWMRTRLNRVNEAEAFLREGLRANPGDPELLFELGRIYAENRRDSERARNVWELALKNWHHLPDDAEGSANFLRAQILGNLAKLEEEQQHYAQAIEYLNELKKFSPNVSSILKWIEDLRRRSAPQPAPGKQ